MLAPVASDALTTATQIIPLPKSVLEHCADWTNVSVSVAFPVPAVLLALSVTVEIPGAVGVPEINPVVLLTDRPDGSPVAP